MKNKQWGKVLSLLLASSMVFTAAVPVYAAQDEKVVELATIEDTDADEEIQKADAPEKVGETATLDPKYGWTVSVGTDDARNPLGTWEDDYTFTIQAGNKSKVVFTAVGPEISDANPATEKQDLVTIKNESSYPVEVINDTDYVGYIYYAGSGVGLLTIGEGTVGVYGSNGYKQGDEARPAVAGETIAKQFCGSSKQILVAKLSAIPPEENLGKQTITFEKPVRLYVYGNNDVRWSTTSQGINFITGSGLTNTDAALKYSLKGFNRQAEEKKRTFLVEECVKVAGGKPKAFSVYTASIYGLPQENNTTDFVTNAGFGINSVTRASITSWHLRLNYTYSDVDKNNLSKAWKPNKYDYAFYQTGSALPGGEYSTEWPTTKLTENGNIRYVESSKEFPKGEWTALIRRQGGNGVFASDWTTTGAKAQTLEEPFTNPIGWTLTGTDGKTYTTAGSVNGKGISVTSDGNNVYTLTVAPDAGVTATAIASNTSFAKLRIKVTNDINSPSSVVVIAQENDIQKEIEVVDRPDNNNATISLGTQTAAIGEDVNFAYRATENMTEPGTYFVGYMPTLTDTSTYFTEDVANDSLNLTSATKYISILNGGTGYKGFEKVAGSAGTVDVMKMAAADGGHTTSSSKRAAHVIWLTNTNQIPVAELKNVNTGVTATLTQKNWTNNGAVFTMDQIGKEFIVVENTVDNREKYEGKYVTPGEEVVDSGITPDDSNKEISVTGMEAGKVYDVYVRNQATANNYSSYWYRVPATLTTNLAGQLKVTQITNDSAKVDLSKVNGITKMCVMEDNTAVIPDSNNDATNKAPLPVAIDTTSGRISGLTAGKTYSVQILDLNGKWAMIDEPFTTPDGYNVSGNVVKEVLPVNSKSTVSENIGLTVNALSGNEVVAELGLDSQGLNKYRGFSILNFVIKVNDVLSSTAKGENTPAQNGFEVGDKITVSGNAKIGDNVYESDVFEFTIGEAVEDDFSINVALGNIADQQTPISKNDVEATITAATTVTYNDGGATVENPTININWSDDLNALLSDNTITVSDNTSVSFNVIAEKNGESASANGVVNFLPEKKEEPDDPTKEDIVLAIGTIEPQEGGSAKAAVEEVIKKAATVTTAKTSTTVSDAQIAITWEDTTIGDTFPTPSENKVYYFEAVATQGGRTSNTVSDNVIIKAKEEPTPTPSANQLNVSMNQLKKQSSGVSKNGLETLIKANANVTDKEGKSVSDANLAVSWNQAMDDVITVSADTTFGFTVTASKDGYQPGSCSDNVIVAVHGEEWDGRTIEEKTYGSLTVDGEIENVMFIPAKKPVTPTVAELNLAMGDKSSTITIAGTSATVEGDLTGLEVAKVQYKNNKMKWVKGDNAKKMPRIILKFKTKDKELKKALKELGKELKKGTDNALTYQIAPFDLMAGDAYTGLQIDAKGTKVKKITFGENKLKKKKDFIDNGDGTVSFGQNYSLKDADGKDLKYNFTDGTVQ